MPTLDLPFPPSCNHHWRVVRGRPIISAEGRKYRETVTRLVGLQRLGTIAGDLHVSLTFYPPDRRRRDVDNMLKPLLDALQHAGVYENDYQISVLHAERRKPNKPGMVTVQVFAIEQGN